MATICRYILDLYQEYFYNRADPRVENFLFMSSLLWPVAIMAFYLSCVNGWGPRLMKNRKPFEMKYFMIAYNILQIAINLYLSKEGFLVAYVKLKYNFLCHPVDYSDNPDAVWLARISWGFFMVKILDLFDTVVMVLRKKENQVSFLHIYHHTGMVAVSWLAAKFIGEGYPSIIGVINCFVHTFMYLYYLLSAMYPEYKKSVWWKKHLTELQMVQFVYMAFHSALSILNPDCNFQKPFMVGFMIQNSFMFAMFLDFYLKTYIKKNNNVTQKDVNKKTN